MILSPPRPPRSHISRTTRGGAAAARVSKPASLAGTVVVTVARAAGRERDAGAVADADVGVVAVADIAAIEADRRTKLTYRSICASFNVPPASISARSKIANYILIARNEVVGSVARPLK